MGAYRFILALFVAYSHFDGSIYNLNPGVVAVISFYILSGYVMSALITKYYTKKNDIIKFYKDRCLRIFPQFFLYTTSSLFLVKFFTLKTAYFSSVSNMEILLNYLLVPQALFMYWANDGSLLIPQAWSLGLESTFYAIIPFILVFLHQRQIIIVSTLSFSIFILAFFGFVNTDYFGYRLLPGTLFVFLIGNAIYLGNYTQIIYQISVVIVCIILLIMLKNMPQFSALHYNNEVVIGILIGTCCVNLLKHLKLKKSMKIYDELLGNLSYGVFLNHILLIWIMDTFNPERQNYVISVIVLFFVSVFVAYVSFIYVELPFVNWRHSLRERLLLQK